MKTLITVTDDDIEKGMPSDCYSCPEVLAILRVVAPRVGVKVEGRDVTLDLGVNYRQVTIEQPMRAACFVLAFDGDEPPEGISEELLAEWREEMTRPFSYVLDIPEEYLPEGAVEYDGDTSS